ncbi:uncharacterized protein A4U43_C03F17560 [Asparagus officinalis]|uniref:Protein kinase domain-containing protein n=1 Tax=Asparagus officinalis TaxID=4686 RepID=A0A5P1FFU5_ASPOF|nr:uncharacterized protein A4U43_C03F17560 [Asparagus officinalis]
MQGKVAFLDGINMISNDLCSTRYSHLPLADAEGVKKHGMIELLKSYGGLSYGQNGSHFEPKPVSPPLPNKCDWEIEPSELDFSAAVIVGKDFRHEVNLLVKLRHPNIVQFLGAVTDRKPLMLITEFLRGGDLHQFLKEKGSLSPSTAVNFALDIARKAAVAPGICLLWMEMLSCERSLPRF